MALIDVSLKVLLATKILDMLQVEDRLGNNHDAETVDIIFCGESRVSLN